ncbi:MurR/RpiR family transcriptional regulator [Halalkalibacter akibai]|uniref:Phosphogluconate repressor HexR n=1 Tax=Halalkalibacter akibai (strain ATCC 43226 / DSM 21942 / CIP 109018 / JCM 9157 / 1139) TaxID=1236973 RepID=W4QP88_HALA3|nr:MurR/RpiR family transcriptional regulator [Halalkalibacter akibai]GAE33732.1 phosphogluconate repressor HexR [Halalkalibacter akibai JCM 9157]
MPFTESHPTITRISSSYSSFSSKEQIIADYILENPKKIIHSTISQIAEDLDIAEATVFRFCKRIGYKGYQAMKIALASEIVTPIENIHEAISVHDDESTVAEKVFRSNIRTLEQTKQIIDQPSFKKAVDAFLAAERIEFYGSGGSGTIANDAHHKFLRIGMKTLYYSDTHLQIMSASQLTPNDLVVIFSHSGASKDSIEVAELVKSTGATVIGITNLAKSPLSQVSDIVLFTASTETEYRSEALASRIAQLSIVDALFVNVSMRRQDEVKDALHKMRNAIAVKRI